MGSRRKPSHDAQPNINQECPRNCETANEIVQTISDEYQICEWFFAIRAGPMTVMPMQELFQRHKYCEPDQNPTVKYGSVPHLVNARRYHMKECATNQ